MPATQDKSAQPHAQSHGLGRLEDGPGLMSQFGFMVRDHEHLRSLLVRCEPENRSAMYELRPSPLRGASLTFKHIQQRDGRGASWI